MKNLGVEEFALHFGSEPQFLKMVENVQYFDRYSRNLKNINQTKF